MLRLCLVIGTWATPQGPENVFSGRGCGLGWGGTPSRDFPDSGAKHPICCAKHLASCAEDPSCHAKHPTSCTHHSKSSNAPKFRSNLPTSRRMLPAVWSSFSHLRSALVGAKCGVRVGGAKLLFASVGAAPGGDLPDLSGSMFEKK